MPPKFTPPRAPEKAKSFKTSALHLAKYLKRYLPAMVVAVIFAVSATVINIISPDKLGDITTMISKDLVAVSQGLKTKIDVIAIGRIGILLAILYLCALTFNYSQSFIMTTVTQRTSQKFRSDISKKINRLPLSYFDSKTHGDILSRVTNDVDTIAMTMNQSIVSTFTSASTIVGLLIMMFVSCWQLALVIITTVPISLIFMKLMVGRSQKYFVRQQQALGELNGHIEESYSGHTSVKAYNAEKEVTDKFCAINENLRANAWKAQFLSGMMHPIMMFVGNLGFAAVCVVGGLLFIDGKIELGKIVTFIMYARMFSNPLGQIAQIATSLQSTMAAAERVFEFLDVKEMEKENATASLPNVRGDVEFKNVTFSYRPGHPIIKNFSASVKAGQKVAIVGPTGAGKTTMVNLLMRFYEIESGDILIDGISIKDLSRENIHNLFSMVLQDTWLFNGTVRENIVYSKTATDEEVERACKMAGISHFIGTLPNGYNTMLDDKSTLSAGQKQLVTIARAMVENAPMLILDEATSSVDTRTETLIQQALDNLTAERTSFIIAHRLSTIKNADLILVMKDGDVIEQGNHDELLALGGFYSELYNSQFDKDE